MEGKKKEPRHRVMTELADILPALTRLSLVRLLLSRAPLRFTGRIQYSGLDVNAKEVHPAALSVKMGFAQLVFPEPPQDATKDYPQSC
jgi:hypothetical protein